MNNAHSVWYPIIDRINMFENKEERQRRLLALPAQEKIDYIINNLPPNLVDKCRGKEPLDVADFHEFFGIEDVRVVGMSLLSHGLTIEEECHHKRIFSDAVSWIIKNLGWGIPPTADGLAQFNRERISNG